MIHFSLSQVYEEANTANMISLLEKCSNMKDLKQIHGQMFKAGLVSDVLLTSKLLELSISLNSCDLSYARKVFDGIRSPNTLMWNTMIKGYANSNGPEEALLFYHQMVSQSVPHNSYTFPFVLKACSSSSALEETQQIHARILKTGFGSAIHGLNSLLHVYSTTCSIGLAKLLFDRIPERDIVSSNLMINGYAKCGEMGKADEIFRNIQEKNIVSWTTMISGYVNAGLEEEALKLFREMQMDSIEPDNKALTSVLSACAHLGALEQGNWIHSYINKNVIQIDPILGCALIDMYVKCGDMEKALEIFGKVKKKDVSTWTAIIEGFAIHGRGIEALEWFNQMQNEGIVPNHVTFTAILTACSYTGLVDEGKSLFSSMRAVHRLNPSIEHYGCMVDILGRAGLVEEAKEFVLSMPITPNAAIWGSLLNACKTHRNHELGKRIGKLLIEVDPEHGGRYIHLSSIHASAGEWNQAVEVRNQMKDLGISKLPGCSSITLNGVAHEFFAGDGSHPQMREIYHEWEIVAERLRREGYEPATGDLLLNL